MFALMKNLGFLFLSLLLSLRVAGGNLPASVHFSNFLSPEKGPYVEALLQFRGISLTYGAAQPSGFQAGVRVNITFSKGDTIVGFAKTQVMGPVLSDTTGILPDFLHVERIALPAGTYQLEITLTDVHRNSRVFKHNQTYPISINPNQSGFSSLQLLKGAEASSAAGPMVKNGLALDPMVSNFVPGSMESITVYGELYGSERVIPAGEKFVLVHRLVADDKTQNTQDYISYKRYDAKGVLPFVHTFDVKKLPSGNYEWLVELRDARNEQKASQRVFFQRSNPQPALAMPSISREFPADSTFAFSVHNLDSIKDFIACTRPIANRDEISTSKNVLASKDLLLCQKFFLGFWLKRSGTAPGKAWSDYKAKVDEVNDMFSTSIQKGYATDRGRVYLQYGKPDARNTFEQDAGTYPYEIWQYYKLHNRTNRRFIFYNRELATNRWVLLHSDAIGERQEPNWQMVLQQRSEFNNNTDVQQGRDYFGNRINENFSTPR